MCEAQHAADTADTAISQSQMVTKRNLGPGSRSKDGGPGINLGFQGQNLVVNVNISPVELGRTICEGWLGDHFGSLTRDSGDLCRVSLSKLQAK